MDVLRAALGDSTLNYLGSSYGTKLGATYAQLFPKRVGRLVLDGAVDPTLGTLASSVQQAGGFQRALDAYAANCIASSGGCFLGSTVPEVEQKISDLLDQVAANPLPAGDRELTAGNAFYGIAVTLYSKDYWVLLSNALRMALAGDGTGLMVLADAYAARNADGTFQNNSMEAFVDISCLDDPTRVPPSEVPVPLPRLREGITGLRQGLRLGAHLVQRLPAPGRGEAAGDPCQGRRPDRGDRYDARPGHALPLGRAPRQGPRLRRPGDPRRRRSHRLPHRQCLHRRRGPRLPGLRRRTADGTRC